MALWIVAILTLCLTLTTDVTAEDAAANCEDIDTSACLLMAAQKHDFCGEPGLAETACPKYCKLCPVECYHCNTSVADFHMCNTTRLCDQGEVCMRKQLKSTMDGHIEYQLTCEHKQTCDGLGLEMSFGKRSVESRDISISCCDTDRCNYPAEMTTTTIPASTTAAISNGCKKDLIVIVDESSSLVRHSTDVLNFLAKVFSTLTIGQNDVLVSMATFTERVKERWELDDHTSSSELMRALSTVHLHGGTADLNDAIRYAIDRVNNAGHHGNRQDAPDVVLFITDDDGHNSVKERVLDNQLHSKADNVIAIGFGQEVTATEMLSLATDASHEFYVHGTKNLLQLYNQVAKLICLA